MQVYTHTFNLNQHSRLLDHKKWKEPNFMKGHENVMCITQNIIYDCPDYSFHLIKGKCFVFRLNAWIT